MNLKEVERTVAKIQGTLFKNANSVSIGQLKSHFKGSGLQFKEHQVYAHGDDVRFIDWKMLAKTDNVYIKTFEEERNVEITVVIDASPSMLIGYKNISKLQAAIEITCLLFLLAEETDDQIECVIITDQIHSLPLSNGRRGMTYLVSYLEKIGVINTDGKVRIDYRPEKILEAQTVERVIHKYMAKKKEIVILTDFQEFISDEYFKTILKRPRVHCVHISSPLDEAVELPYSVFGFAYSNSGSIHRNVFRTKTIIPKEGESLHQNRSVKKVSVARRYLEDFIKEMV